MPVLQVLYPVSLRRSTRLSGSAKPSTRAKRPRRCASAWQSGPSRTRSCGRVPIPTPQSAAAASSPSLRTCARIKTTHDRELSPVERIKYVRTVSTMSKVQGMLRRVASRPQAKMCTDISFKIVKSDDTLNVSLRAKIRTWVAELKACPYAAYMDPSKVNGASPDIFIVYAFSGKLCVGAAMCQLQRGYYGENYQSSVNIMLLCSAKTCKGAGSYVVWEVERIARQYGCTKVHLYSADTATGFYNKMGYTRKCHGRPMTRGAWRNERLYEKNIK